MTARPDRLIINSPFEEPSAHWRYVRETKSFSKEAGRRAAGYVRATPGSTAADDPGVFFEIPLVNQIRPRVAAWRSAGYPGVTGTTKRLLAHWRDPETFAARRFFFCQLEAIETLIWLTEAPAAERQGIAVPGDGGAFPRLCAKMATGSGKTIVMAMALAWQILNRVESPQDRRFSKHALVIAPGLTVRSRLSVLEPAAEGNYYDLFDVVPAALRERLRQGRVLVRNWHALGWESEEQVRRKRRVDKRGPKSDEAYVRAVLGELAGARNLLVINDEAHHAWRVPAEAKYRGEEKRAAEEATKWVGGLDRIHRARGIQACFDFTATPFMPSGRGNTEESLFSWIVSDFGLNDAIEAGLVKTPRVVVRDDGLPDAGTYRSKLYHIYEHVRDDLNRKAEESDPLPALVRTAYYLLGKDWLETAKSWAEKGHPVPPVMITVANRTETAARVKHAFDRGRILIEELCDPERTLHIDSKVLEEAEAREEPATAPEPTEERREEDEGGEEDAPKRKLTKQELAERLRRMVDTVGQPGKPGGAIQNVISVGMLSEGWDAKTVTHVMGLRAFTSQLLCEQVVGRGLRRTSYEVDPETGLYQAEYVNVFGVPFSFLPFEGGEELVPNPPAPKTRIEPVLEKKGFEIAWPNVVRVDQEVRPTLTLDLAAVPPLVLNAHDTASRAALGAVLDGKADLEHVTEIDLRGLAERMRIQRIVFETARDVYDRMEPTWKGRRELLIGQLVGIVDSFLGSDRLVIQPAAVARDAARRRILLALLMTPVVQHLWQALRFQNAVRKVPVFDKEQPIRATGDMLPWYSGKACHPAARSHINFCVYDSTWESHAAEVLDSHPRVAAWAKNDHLGFEVVYVFDGIVKKYRPDFLVRRTDGTHLVLEIKGREGAEESAKRHFLAEWVEAVNAHGGFGTWRWAVSFTPSDVEDRIDA